MPRRPRRSHRLSKSRFVTGWQCVKHLWWKVHEPQAPELQIDKVLQDRFDQGRHVGEVARTRFPGGVLIDWPHNEVDLRLEATRNALDRGAPAIFEASFLEDDVYVAVDVLERGSRGFTLIEVKSASSQKDEHVPDAAVQAHVARRAGLDVTRVEIMHLNKEYRHPDRGDLFQRSDVTAPVEQFVPQVPEGIERQLATLAGPLPDVPVGLHCFEPWTCPFFERCWPADRDHIRHLYYAGPAVTVGWMRQGVHRIADLPPGTKLNHTQRRQVKALAERRLVVEPPLAAELAALDVDRVGFLDFETIQRAVPVWRGQKPWEQTAVQFSYHERQPDGSYPHEYYLAEGPEDPRAEIADLLIAATARADRIVHYSHFEKTRIKALAEQVPARAAELLAIADRLVDLLPIVRNHVYHPEFGGSFSLKHILTPLVPDVTYDDLAIVDGMVASVEIARLLFFAHLVEDRAKTRQDLLDYCERDTWAMVRLVERLRELAGGGE